MSHEMINLNEMDKELDVMEMNKHILLVMKWLNDKNSVTQKELGANRTAAYAAAYTAAYAAAYTDADAAAYTAAYAAAYTAADAAADAAYTAAYAAYTAADAAYAASAEKWVNKYFERTGEDKQVYIDALKPKEEQPVFTQAMVDNGELPQVGMEFMWRSWGKDKVCEMLGVYGDECWIKCDGKTLVVGNITNVKPIDTRTNKEKAVDEISLTLDGMSKNNSSQETAEVLMHFILENKFHGVKWVGE